MTKRPRMRGFEQEFDHHAIANIRRIQTLFTRR
jgi:hypothetical protein